MADGVPKYLLATRHENWDFESVSEPQLEECFFYEFGRESPKVRSRIANFRRRSREYTFESLLAVQTSGFPTVRGFSPQWKGIAPYCPEFPETPFLALSDSERRCRIQMYQRGEQRRLREAAMFQAGLRKIMSHFQPADVSDGIIPSDSADSAIVAFTINWSLSDKELSQQLGNWLRVYRSAYSSVEVSETRGAGSKARQYARKLKALGAMRLFRASDSWQDAYDISATRRNGKALFSDQAGWRRAFKATAECMAEFGG